MSRIIDLAKAAAKKQPSELDALTARLALEHGAHESAVLPCYLCLHGVRIEGPALARAA